MSRTFRALCVATCAFAMLITPATAADTTRARAAVAVHYGDLNLYTTAGATALIRRLEQAARQTCGNEANAQTAVARRQRACQTAAVGKAVAKLDNLVVATVYAEQPNGRFMISAR